MLENNLENKAKFFAQYWGQNVRFWTFNGPNVLGKVGATYMTKVIVESCSLQLKTLSAISDEQAKKLAQLRWGNDVEILSFERLEYGIKYHYIINGVTGVTGQHEGIFTRRLYAGESDYLRGEGFLIDFNGKSEEEILTDGWAVLEQEA